MPVEGLTFFKESLERIGFDLSKPYDELIKESYINTVIFSNIGNDKYARFVLINIFLSLKKHIKMIYTIEKSNID